MVAIIARGRDDFGPRACGKVGCTDEAPAGQVHCRSCRDSARRRVTHPSQPWHRKCFEAQPHCRRRSRVPAASLSLANHFAPRPPGPGAEGLMDRLCGENSAGANPPKRPLWAHKRATWKGEKGRRAKSRRSRAPDGGADARVTCIELGLRSVRQFSRTLRRAPQGRRQQGQLRPRLDRREQSR